MDNITVTHDDNTSTFSFTNTTEEEAIKAGARNSKKDAERLQMIHDYARENGAMCKEEMKEESPMKATGIDAVSTPYNTPPIAIKIAGEMELDVCYMPYTGQKNGKDADNQYFSPRTKEHSDKFPTPLVLYYHGYEARGIQQPMPEEIGSPTGKKWVDGAGRWLRVKLDATKEKAMRVWNSALKGNARASSDSIAHLVRVAPDGEILNWAFVGISLFETETGKKPANSFALAIPAAKALGLEFPETLEEDDDGEDIKQLAAVVAAVALNMK